MLQLIFFNILFLFSISELKICFLIISSISFLICCFKIVLIIRFLHFFITNFSLFEISGKNEFFLYKYFSSSSSPKFALTLLSSFSFSSKFLLMTWLFALSSFLRFSIGLKSILLYGFWESLSFKIFSFFLAVFLFKYSLSLSLIS